MGLNGTPWFTTSNYTKACSSNNFKSVWQHCKFPKFVMLLLMIQLIARFFCPLKMSKVMSHIDHYKISLGLYGPAPAS